MAGDWEEKSKARPKVKASGALRRSTGLFTKSEIDKLIRNRFTKKGFVIDPYNYIQKTHELVFFTKPDLHIVGGATTSLDAINPELSNDPFFIDLIDRYPHIVNQLQKSSKLGGSNYLVNFSNLLTYFLNGSLDLPSVTAESSDLPENVYGTAYSYRTTGEAADDNPTFSLEFKDGPNLDAYLYFKAYERYEQFKNHGLVSPFQSYITNKELHDVMGIYKFTLDQDMSTIIHYAYWWGAQPMSVPRDAFSTPVDGGFTFSVDWKAAFVDDMDPNILSDFNVLTDSAWVDKGGNGWSTSDSAVAMSFNAAISGGMDIGVKMEDDFVLNNLYTVPHIIQDNNKKYHLVWR